MHRHLQSRGLYLPIHKLFFEQGRENIQYILLGRVIPSCDKDELVRLWCISGRAISSVYQKAMMVNRTGVQKTSAFCWPA